MIKSFFEKTTPSVVSFSEEDRLERPLPEAVVRVSSTLGLPCRLDHPDGQSRQRTRMSLGQGDGIADP